MKKSVFLAVFCLAIGAASSSGQGYVVFSSYIANGGIGALTSFAGYDGHMTYSGPVPEGFTAELYYALGTISDPVNISSASSTSTDPTGLTDSGVTAAYDNSGGATGAAGLGYFDGGVVTIPGYAGGPVTFEVVAFSGSSYSDSAFRGRSGAFTMDSIATSTSIAATFFGDNGQPMPNFYIFVIPEPTTLALAGLGGLVSLVMFRRKHS
jgi:hypothetical protein